LLDIQVFDLKHLNAIMTQLKAKSVVSRVERVNG
jgi:(p)ppGpp synthase/HD superfamily hydrolase